MSAHREVKLRIGIGADDYKIIRLKIWFVILLWEGNEAKIAKKLGEENCYLPCMTKWARVRRRKKGEPSRVRKLFPLLPGFLFFSGDFDIEENHWVYNDKKVIGVLRGIVHDYEVERLRISEAGGDWDETRELFSGIVGTSFEIMTGPFANRTAHVVDIVQGHAILDLGGKSHPIMIPLSKLDEIREIPETGLPGTRARR